MDFERSVVLLVQKQFPSAAFEVTTLLGMKITTPLAGCEDFVSQVARSLEYMVALWSRRYFYCYCYWTVAAIAVNTPVPTSCQASVIVVQVLPKTNLPFVAPPFRSL
ncbi:hypothetical protein T09_4728 [Trichinella sp. T9]|nr:hypothetical protein T09_4728 [Trichinella sp. T9]